MIQTKVFLFISIVSGRAGAMKSSPTFTQDRSAAEKFGIVSVSFACALTARTKAQAAIAAATRSPLPEIAAPNNVDGQKFIGSSLARRHPTCAGFTCCQIVGRLGFRNL